MKKGAVGTGRPLAKRGNVEKIPEGSTTATRPIGLVMAMKRTDRERRLRIFETNYAREAGWYVEHHGRRIARLTAPRCEEMFCDSYRIEPLTEGLEEA